MPRTADNMRPTGDSVLYCCDKVHPIPDSCSATIFSSSSTSSPDLSGFDYNTGPSHYDFYNQKLQMCISKGGISIGSINFPPSPPPTNSDPKRSVPLPSLSYNNTDPGPSSPPRFLRNSPSEAISSSPMIKHPAFGLQAPLTPPPTLPTPTLALPPISDEPLFIPKVDELDPSLLSLPSPSTSPDQNRMPHHLLSPISPEWTTNNIVYETPLPFNSDSSILLYGNHHLISDSFQYVSDNNINNNALSQCRPTLPPLDIPNFPPSPKSAWSESSAPSSMDVDYDDELDLLSTPTSPHSSPFIQKHDLESDSLMFDDDFSDDKYQSFPHFSPPHLHQIQFLPELDDILASPSSPSLRPFSSLPSLSPEDEEDMMLVSSPSPSRPLISLPGADTDDDLIPAELGLSPHPPFPTDLAPLSPYASASSLLLLDDPNDVPLPRSPSPEPFDLDDPALFEGCTDPDVRRLRELRRRSQNAERAARSRENAMLEQGVAHERWEARRIRKKEKERGREIGTMLRLKVAEKEEEKGKQSGSVAGRSKEGESEDDKEKGQLAHKRSGGIQSMEQLVAKMLLRRNDSYRSLVNRKTPITSKFHASSPLARHSLLPVADEVDELDVSVNGGSFMSFTKSYGVSSLRDPAATPPWTMKPLDWLSEHSS